MKLIMKLMDKYEIIQNNLIHTNIYSMEIKTPIGKNSKPGMFVMLYLDNGANLLPRPISISDASDNTITLIYAVVGAGTKELSKFRQGDKIRVMGPIGNGFNFQKNFKSQKIALVGGGVGVPPIYFLAKDINNKINSKDIDVYLGFREQSILEKEFCQYTNHLNISLDKQQKGNVIDLLKSSGKQYDQIFACGPTPMLKALQSYAKETGVNLEISLEEHMACGIGTCVGCVVQTTEGTFEKICTKGPVFQGGQVVL